MKKKVSAIFIVLLLSCVLLAACTPAYTNPAVLDMTQNSDANYVVLSNGGSAVQYGKYVYFINGYSGYDDTGSDNVWGKVNKGGLFRAELKGNKEPFYYLDSFGLEVKDLYTYVSSFDANTSYNFVSNTEKGVITGYLKDDDGNILYDENDEPIAITTDVEQAEVARVASKKIGTSGYKKGGLFIYGDYIYYATPSNHENRNSSIATDRTEFYRTKLDGTSTKLIYTSSSATSSSAYAFYEWGDKVYLVLQDGSDLISVVIGSKKVEAVKKLASDVTGVLLPYKDVYFKGIDKCGVEDFIYYTRAYTKEDNVKSGNVLTVMRPDGSEMIELKDGSTKTLKNTDNGYLFYEEQNATETVIKYTNLHDQLMWTDEGPASPTYAEAYNAALPQIQEVFKNSPLVGDQSGVAFSRDTSAYNDIVCVRPDKRSNQVFALCMSSSGLFIASGADYFETLYTSSVDTIYAVVGTDVYFNSGSTFYLADRTPSGVELVTVAENVNSSATFGLDVVGNLVVVFGEVDEYANDYALFMDLSHLDDKQFVGARDDDDKYDPEVDLNPVEEESEDEEE